MYTSVHSHAAVSIQMQHQDENLGLSYPFMSDASEPPFLGLGDMMSGIVQPSLYTDFSVFPDSMNDQPIDHDWNSPALQEFASSLTGIRPPSLVQEYTSHFDELVGYTIDMSFPHEEHEMLDNLQDPQLPSSASSPPINTSPTCESALKERTKNSKEPMTERPSTRAWCQTCGQTFKGYYQKANLKRHMKSIHSRGGEISDDRVCRCCGLKFRRSDARKKHEWRTHQLEEARPTKKY